MLDLIFLAFLFLGSYSGYKRGFILEVIGIIGIFVGLYIALKLLKWSLGYVIRIFPGFGNFLPLFLFVFLFVLILIFVNVLGKMLKKFIDATIFGPFDNLAGAVMGFFLWSFMISLALWIMTQANIHLPETWVQKSYVYPYIVKIAPTLIGYISSLFPFAGTLISDIKEILIK